MLSEPQAHVPVTRLNSTAPEPLGSRPFEEFTFRTVGEAVDVEEMEMLCITVCFSLSIRDDSLEAAAGCPPMIQSVVLSSVVHLCNIFSQSFFNVNLNLKMCIV